MDSLSGVGVPGFEPGVFCSQNRRIAKLSHTPMSLPLAFQHLAAFHLGP